MDPPLALGGGVGTRGPGETQLEVDRRRVRERIAALARRLGDVDRTRRLHRDERDSRPVPDRRARRLHERRQVDADERARRGAGVLVEDRLFATLDSDGPARSALPEGAPALLADTVGFIHKLPHQLVEAFKSTLEQVAKPTCCCT